MAARARAVPALRRPTASTCCASSATTAAPPTTPRRRVRGADRHPGRHRRRATAPPTCSRPPAASRDRMLELGEQHGYRNAQVTCIAPTGTIGLVMDCDTTGVEPDFALVKFKKLAGGGYFKIINAVDPAGAAHGSATRRAQIDDIVRYCAGRGTLAGLPAHQPRRRSRPRASPTRCSRRIEAAAARRVRVAVRLQPLDARRRLPARHSSASPTTQLAERPVRPAHAPSASRPQQIDRGQRLRLRHHDHRGRAAPEARALPGLRLRQQVRQERASASSSPESHIRMMAAAQPFISGAISQDDQHAPRRHRRGRQERLPAELATDAQGQRALPRRLEAEPAAQHRGRRADEEDGRRRADEAGGRSRVA